MQGQLAGGARVFDWMARGFWGLQRTAEQRVRQRVLRAEQLLMSSRALRRLQREKRGGAAELEGGSSSEELPLGRTSLNAFCALSLSSGGEESATDEEECAREAAAVGPAKKSLAPAREGPRGAPQACAAEDDIDELYAAFVAAGAPRLQGGASEREEGAAGEDEQWRAIFTLGEGESLEAAVEMRRKLGGTPTATLDAPRRGGRPHRRGGARGGRQIIGEGERGDAWPRHVTPSSVGLRLEAYVSAMYGADDGHVCRLVASPAYERELAVLQGLCNVGHIEGVFDFVGGHPCHVDGLLIVSDALAMSSGADAGEYCERALYVLERVIQTATGHAGWVGAGRLRLPYEEAGNRRMHLLLVRHLQGLVRRGCYRTALALGKVLWSLDPLVDPLAFLLVADFVALQADDLAWFDAVYGGIIQAECPWMANWHYSQALSYLLGKRHATPTRRAGGKAAQAGGEAAQAGGRLLLGEAVRGHPWMVPHLARACKIPLDEAAWNARFGLQCEVQGGAAPALAVAISLREVISRVYAARCGILWASNAHALRALTEQIGDAAASGSPASLLDYRPTAMEALPIMRHSLVSDLPRVTVPLPPGLFAGRRGGRLGAAVTSLNPLPPEDVPSSAGLPASAEACTIQ